MLFLRSFLMLLLLSNSAFANDWYGFFDQHFVVNHRGVEIHVGVLENAHATGTVVYMPGFADTIDNHEALLKGFRDQGLQVIAFDYPEHGLSGGSIRWWGLQELAQILPSVLADHRTGFQASLPLVLAGWSTGGTIAIRIAQAWRNSALPKGVRLSGVVAFAPALPAKVVIKVQKESVTEGEMKHSPSPATVPVLGQFATSITMQSRLGFLESMPSDVATLILFAGDRDNYAISSGSLKWVKREGAHVLGFQCEGAMHGFEFEAGYGAESKALATRFAKAVVREGASSFQGAGEKFCPRVAK